MKIFDGIATAIVTPFLNNEVDYQTLKKIIEFQENANISTLVLNGTTAEAPTLSLEEQIQIINFVLENKKEKTKIIAGISENDTYKATKKAQKLSKLNIDGLLVLTPFYNKTNDQGMELHFLEIIKNTHLPIILYHIPTRTGCGISYNVLNKLAKLDQVVGIKYADESISYAQKILKNIVNENFAFYAGNDDLLYLFATLNSSGAISATSNVIPLEMIKIYEEIKKNNYQEALKTHNLVLDFNQAIFLETNPILLKYAMSLLGFATLEYRLPLCSGSLENQNIIKEHMKGLKLI